MNVTEEEIALIGEYNEWVLDRKRTVNDQTPEQFAIERAQKQALERLIRIDEYIQSLTDQEDFRVKSIKRILNGG